MPARIAVFASGGGSNLEAILEHFQELGERACGRVVLVASDRADAPALEKSRRRGIATAIIADPRDGGEICELLGAHDVDLLALAGYLRLVPQGVIAAYRHRIVNVHPAPLPAFGGRGMYGRRVHEAVLSAGVRATGVTVHLVDEQYDHGDVIAHWPVTVRDDDTVDSLARRVLAVEHILYPRILDMIAALTPSKAPAA